MENKILKELYKLSLKAAKKEEMPVAAILLYDNKIIAKAYNKRNKTELTTDHAEIQVIKKANKKLKTWRLNKCTIYVTMKPCEMCESVIREARINEVFYLIDRMPEKRQYYKTEIKKINNELSEKIEKKYLEILNDFWKIRRKK
ncbi:MAG: nucleoside deaminase [Mollicutes bacterium]|jgi:tRNA(adenine34) deaminase|nr:nucleoside deaminase [Mollicutes bacterium]